MRYVMTQDGNKVVPIRDVIRIIKRGDGQYELITYVECDAVTLGVYKSEIEAKNQLYHIATCVIE